MDVKQSRPASHQNGRRIGYARVSTIDQYCEVQQQELKLAGCVTVYSDMMSGTRADRPELARAVRSLQKGDTLVVVRLDRLGRSILHVPALLKEIEDKGAFMLSLRENFDSATAAGKLMRNVMISFGDFERELIVERTKAGLATARERGWVPGNPAILRGDKEVIARIRASRHETLNQKSIAASEPWIDIVRSYRPLLAWNAVLNIINQRCFKDGRGLRLDTLQRHTRRLVGMKMLPESVLKRTSSSSKNIFAGTLAQRLKRENPTWSLRRLGEELDLVGVRPPRGGAWHPTGVQRLLEEETS